MSYARVTLDWPGGRDDFAVDWVQMRALETATGQGPMALLRALQAGSFRVDQMLAVLRCGLAGAGAEAREADRRIAAAIVTSPPAAFLQPAILVLAAGLAGVAAEAPPEGEATDGE